MKKPHNTIAIDAELGSGILPTTRLMKEYASKSKALFIEGASFKTIVSLPDGKAVVINDTVKQRMTRVIQELIKQPGLKSKDLAKESSGKMEQSCH